MDAGRVSDIHKRIDKLSSEISRQREILRDLENQKSAAQSELNTILDPMSQLPLEISSDIMLWCLPTTAGADPHAAPMVFLNICRSWSIIALATPVLWATMRIETAMSDDYGKLMGLWVARAGIRPLTLSIGGSMDSETDAHRTFLEFCLWDRVQTLNVYLPSGDQLGELKGPFPHLHALTISQQRNSDEWDGNVQYYSRNASECIEMLSAAPNLVEFALNDIQFESSLASPLFRVVTHSNIKHLYLGGYCWDIDFDPSSAYMLQYLTLPSLERLAISSFDIEFEDFLVFLARSAPPLRFLSMPVPSEYLEARDAPMERLFRLAPMITDLDLSPSTYWVGDVIASVLHAINSPLLPDLRNLTVHFYSSHHGEPPPYEEVLGSLSGRLTYSPMQEFKLMFRQLEEDGMQIHVGTPKRNFI
ncbi:hypothetical protein B0H11DRAFT_2065506 [Mycena galericulata]|nr:hypothetical protein B0H11DRAFT_2137979 [Mycena galericulata]KAJ7456791.1 hypothetical protein B0H11DRAFT_2065506 [Mycena galericulata]